jgi:hypothetical protein
MVVDDLRELIARNAEDYVRLERKLLALKSERNEWLVAEQHMKIRIGALEDEIAGLRNRREVDRKVADAISTKTIE